MTKQQTDDPRMYELASGFREQQHPLRLEHPMEFSQGVFLVHEVMKGLVTEDQIDRTIRKCKMRGARCLELDFESMARSLRTRRRDHSCIDVDRYQLPGLKATLQ